MHCTQMLSEIYCIRSIIWFLCSKVCGQRDFECFWKTLLLIKAAFIWLKTEIWSQCKITVFYVSIWYYFCDRSWIFIMITPCGLYSEGHISNWKFFHLIFIFDFSLFLRVSEACKDLWRAEVWVLKPPLSESAVKSVWLVPSRGTETLKQRHRNKPDWEL